ncbi:MAG: diphosphomevalonate decarboxylase [Bdellovibrionota bacterium]
MNVSSVKRWTAEAPSNIALIKYMGKIDGGAANQPTNTSLSFTLGHLKSIVQLEYDEHFAQDTWEPLTSFSGRTFETLQLNQKGIDRFVAHLSLLKTGFDFKGHFKIRSANDFPSDCGLASSASSFAALTKVGLVALAELTGKPVPTATEAANWSRRGSGSSCRSFFEPWVLWAPDHVSDVPALKAWGNLIHQVVVVNAEVKAVPSSEAHKRVTSSLLFAGRPNRADVRVPDFVKALETERWRDAFEIAWTEFWDMHALFETSQPSFGYMTAGSLEVLNFVRESLWVKENDGPIVTMDAGPNVHLLYRNDDRGRRAAAKVSQNFAGKFRIYSSEAMK